MGVAENKVRFGRRYYRPTLNKMLSYGLHLKEYISGWCEAGDANGMCKDKFRQFVNLATHG